MRNLKITIQYNGSNYCGWQKQPDSLGIQGTIEKAIHDITREEVDGEFHSRYNAKGKTYRYLIHNSMYRSPIYKDISYHVKYDLDFDKMLKESKYLIGTHDFKGFMSSGSSVKDTVREIYGIRLTKQEDLIVLEVEGNGLLYNMVRIIVGTLVDIGRGRK